MTYEERLRKLNQPTLIFRRLRGDAIEMYKIFNHYDADPDMLFQRKNSNTRGHNFKLFKKRSKSSFRLHSFSRQTIDMWNSLPSDVVTAGSVNMFKNKLDKHWKYHNLCFNCDWEVGEFE